MAIQKNSTRPVILAPQGLTNDHMVNIRNGFVAHFQKVLTPEILIAHRKATYALVINASSNGVKLEQMVGTENAKLITTDILDALLANIAVVPTIAGVNATPASTTYQP